MKNKKNIVVLGIVFVLLLCVGCSSSKLSSYVDNTKIGKNTTSYRLDLRIYGTYNKKNIRRTVMIDNYMNTDKRITMMNIAGLKLEEKTYILKDKKYYEVVDDKLKDIKNVSYEDTDVYLTAVNNITDLSSPKTEKIGESEYTVYTGKIEKKIINKMLKTTDLDIKVSENGTAEVWLTKDNRIYKVYYKVGDLTIYPSFLIYNNVKQINLDMYK